MEDYEIQGSSFAFSAVSLFLFPSERIANKDIPRFAFLSRAELHIIGVAFSLPSKSTIGLGNPPILYHLQSFWEKAKMMRAVTS